MEEGTIVTASLTGRKENEHKKANQNEWQDSFRDYPFEFCQSDECKYIIACSKTVVTLTNVTYMYYVQTNYLLC